MIATEINLFEELKTKTLQDAVVNWNAAKVTADGHVSMIQDAVEIVKRSVRSLLHADTNRRSRTNKLWL